MTDASWAAIILAAGKGVRMRSSLPKMLHPLAGKPMIRHAVDAARAAGVADIIAVVGHEAGKVQAVLGPDVRCVQQAEQLGTGHAVAQAREAAGEAANVLVLSGDVPLTTAETLRALMERHLATGAALTFLTAEVSDPTGLGRVVRYGGRVHGIVEEADADAATLAIHEINAGVYCFRGDWLWQELPRLPVAANGEYYLTALMAQDVAEGAGLDTLTAADPDEAFGVNDRAQLARAESVLRKRILHRLMVEDGVTIIDPATTYIDDGVSIGQDTVIEPNTYIRGDSAVGAGCVIGPNATLRNARIGEHCTIGASFIEDSELEANVSMGPYGHVRGGAYLESGAELGDHVEIKNSRIGRDSKVHHFSYIGDTDMGANVNIGAGTVTCNYDGVDKHRTTIGEGVFIGSDSMLIAPVMIGRGAKTGAGSVVTHDVEDGAVVFGAPARPRGVPASRDGGS